MSRCMHGYADDRPCDRCAPTADERRVEVAAEALLAVWSVASDPVSQALARAAAERDALAVVAALDAHDGDLRERLAGAVEARRDPDPGYADLYGNGYNDGLTDAARIIRERP